MQIYAGNLSKEVTEDDLRKAFREHGEVSFVNIVRDRANRISAGYGFIEMPVVQEAEAAILGLNKIELKGNPINVKAAQTRPAVIL